MVVEQTTQQLVLFAVPPGKTPLSPFEEALAGVLNFADQINTHPTLQKGQTVIKQSLGPVDTPLFVHENWNELKSLAKEQCCSVCYHLFAFFSSFYYYIILTLPISVFQRFLLY